MPDERATGDDLMREGESQRQIGIEVNDPPRLVLQPATRIADGGHARQNEKAESGGGSQHVRVRGEECPELMQAPDLLELRIPKGDEHDVEGDEHQGPPPDAAVPADERILSDSALQPWHARDQQNHHEHQIGADESGQATAGDQHASGSGERATRLAGDDQGDGGAQAETHERCERVCHEGHGGGGSASPGTSGADRPGAVRALRRCCEHLGLGCHAAMVPTLHKSNMSWNYGFLPTPLICFGNVTK